MKRKSPQGSRGKRWLLRLMAVPALYVLSMGPVAGLIENGTIPRQHFDWLRKFYAPLEFLSYSNTSNILSSAYVNWWIFLLEKPEEKVAGRK
jgi:hypothetical protein